MHRRVFLSAASGTALAAAAPTHASGAPRRVGHSDIDRLEARFGDIMFVSSGLWAAIDGNRFGDAQQHLDRASRLAAMSGDQTIQFRIWSHGGSLYRHMRRTSDALAANDAARSLPVTRRDPMFASLGHARHAAILGLQGSTSAVERALDHAHAAYGRAEKVAPSRPHAAQPRPDDGAPGPRTARTRRAGSGGTVRDEHRAC